MEFGFYRYDAARCGMRRSNQQSLDFRVVFAASCRTRRERFQPIQRV